LPAKDVSAPLHKPNQALKVPSEVERTPDAVLRAELPCYLRQLARCMHGHTRMENATRVTPQVIFERY